MSEFGTMRAVPRRWVSLSGDGESSERFHLGQRVRPLIHWRRSTWTNAVVRGLLRSGRVVIEPEGLKRRQVWHMDILEAVPRRAKS